MTAPQPIRSGPSRKAVLGWSAAMLAVLGLAWFAGAVGYPLIRNRLLVRQILNSPDIWRGTATASFDLGSRPACTALTRLAELQGREPKNYVEYQRKPYWPIPLTGWGARVSSDGKPYVVAVMSPEVRWSPGTSVQQLILLDQNGRILDKLACSTGSRFGVVRTEVKASPAADGAQIVIRYISDTGLPGGHAGHFITHDQEPVLFTEGDELRSAVWKKKGLCRIRVADDRFEIVFPEMKNRLAER